MTEQLEELPELPEPHYSIAQLAALWSVSRDTVERLIDAGELRAVRIASVRRIPASAILAYANREPAEGVPA